MANFLWTVVGAGPAGIAAVGQVLDAGVDASQIAWIDPRFSVGDFGTCWKRVVSNTTVESFLKFYNAFNSFNFQRTDRKAFIIERMKPEMRCPLMVAADPLKWITSQLRQKVVSLVNKVQSLQLNANTWQLTLANGETLTTQKVVLAQGAEADSLRFPSLATIPLTIAADPQLLTAQVQPEDTIAAFGSYQSARTVAENLMKTSVKRVFLFYRSERSFQNNVASLELPEHFIPVHINSNTFLKYIPQCDKAIYAVGFSRRQVAIADLPEDYLYDTDTGQIAPGIYGLGIAFPETVAHMMGRETYRVTAIWPFVKHLKKIFPLWLQDTVMLEEAPELQMMPT